MAINKFIRRMVSTDGDEPVLGKLLMKFAVVATATALVVISIAFLASVGATTEPDEITPAS